MFSSTYAGVEVPGHGAEVPEGAARLLFVTAHVTARPGSRYKHNRRNEVRRGAESTHDIAPLYSKHARNRAGKPVVASVLAAIRSGQSPVCGSRIDGEKRGNGVRRDRSPFP